MLRCRVPRLLAGSLGAYPTIPCPKEGVPSRPARFDPPGSIRSLMRRTSTDPGDTYMHPRRTAAAPCDLPTF
jgi:hypothetical protein